MGEKDQDEETEAKDMTSNCDEQQQTPCGCSSSISNSSCFPSEESLWLALATSNPSYLEKSNRG